MLLQKKTPLQICLWLAALCVTCACTRGLAPDQNARLYHKPYDKVWEAVTGVILDDLGCIESTLKKNKGYLEHEWVSLNDAVLIRAVGVLRDQDRPVRQDPGP